MALYENPFHYDNVYGHVADLLRENTFSSEGAHLDFGCNVGPIAESVRSLGREYIGFDIDEDALSILRERGFEAYNVDLLDSLSAETFVRGVLNGRRVASISIIDTLEHLTNGPDVLAMLHRLASESNAALITSVPNVTHRDVGFKLAMGRWDYTPKGLLDHTHVQFFTERGLRSMMRQTGWHETAIHDIRMEQSDQAFPINHPAIGSASPLHKLLDHIRTQVDDTARTYQFVRMWLPGPVVGPGYILQDAHESRPFLSVITRTQGRRIDTLRDVLLCLSAQSDSDFEVCIVGHKMTLDAQLSVERLIEDTNEGMRSRIRLIKVDTGNRTHPLNVGFREARGEYVAILDDDDIVFGHWVEEFRKLASKSPSAVLRATNASQLWQPVKTAPGTQTVRATGSPLRCYPNTFDMLDHLVENASPPVSLAFPRSAFADLGITFDESLTTTEDWDFLLRTAAVCGVASSQEITSIYRQWENAESSFTVHSREEWLENHHAIWRKIGSAPMILDQKDVTRLRHLVTEYNSRQFGKRGPVPDALTERERYEDSLRERIHGLLTGRAWQLTAIVRAPSALLGRRMTFPPLWAMDAAQLEACQRDILNSRSFKLASRLKRLLRRAM